MMLKADRVVRETQIAVGRAREELFLSCVPPRLREGVTFRIYEDYSQRHGNDRCRLYPRELFPWERELFTSDPFPPAGRILLGAAGDGREMIWLLDMGYEVVAFEPSGLVDDAIEATIGDPKVKVIRASYRTLIDGLEHGLGPLTGAVASAFDAVILGWGSLSHVWDGGERSRLVMGLHRRWPRTPVFMSFFHRDERRAEPQRVLRRVLRLCGAPGCPAPGLRFMHESGFAQEFSTSEIERLAVGAGYRVVRLVLDPFPHAVLS